MFFVEKQGYILLHPDIQLVLECLHISKYVYIQSLSEQFSKFARPILTTIEALDTSRLPIADIEKLW